MGWKWKEIGLLVGTGLFVLGTIGAALPARRLASPKELTKNTG